MSTPTATGTSPTTSDVTKDNFIPLFNNKTEHYKGVATEDPTILQGDDFAE